MIKVDIFSGFLGAGKTTLIKKLFESNIKNEQVVIIENEFGQINIDGAFLKDAGVQIKEINSGCICCSLVGDFEKSLKEIIHTYNPDRIIIEPSGVGKLSDIIEAVEKITNEDLKINILCTIVDGKKAKLQLNNFGEFFINQVKHARSIVISKSDLINEEKLHETVHIIKDVNESASIITTPIEELNGNNLLKFLEENTNLNDLIEQVNDEHHHDCKHHHEHDEECCCHEHHHEHDEKCCCHEHHHEHDEDCCCHEHHHHHDEECCCHEHHHEHDEDCCCHEHHHEHEEDCCCHEHHHEHDEDCCCHEHHHKHDEDCCCHEHHHHHDEGCCCHEHHHADDIFSSWGIETVKSVSKESLTNFLNELSSHEELGTILRSKGILKANDQDSWYYFDYVSGDFSIRNGDPDYTGRIVVIGSHLNEKAIEELFYKEA